MRINPAVLFIALLAMLVPVSCCCGDDSPTPSRARYDGPSPITIASHDAQVTFDLSDRFKMHVASADGRILFDSSDEDPSPNDATKAYGEIGATHRDIEFKPSFIEGFDHVTPTDAPWFHAKTVASVKHTETFAKIELFDPATPEVTITLNVAVENAEVAVEATIDDPRKNARPLNMIGQSFDLDADEQFVGLGEREAGTSHRGRHYQCWTEEGGLGGGENAAPNATNPAPNGPGMTHLPVPFIISSHGYGLWLDTTYRTGFALGAEDQYRWRIYAEESRLKYRVFVHENPRDTLAAFTARVGRAELPAPWVFGPRRRVDPGTMVDGVPEEIALRDRGVPTTMIDDTTHFLPNASHRGREAELTAWTTRLHALGYKAIGYFNGHVSTEVPDAAQLLAEGRAKNAFVRLDDGTEFDTFMVSGGSGKVATIDFTSPGATAWYQGKLQQALDLGYDGWMLDFGEYLPQHAKLHDGKTGFEAHNLYPLLLQHATYDYLRRVRGNDFMMFTRSGYTGTQATTSLVWSGDPSASFDDARGLPAQVRAGIGAGLSGIPFWGSDISGFTCFNDPPADKEVYLRWAEFGALSSDMHDETACAGAKTGTRKWTLWSDEETVATYGTYASLHTRLFPYLYAAAKEATETGMPVMRHPLLMSPREPNAWTTEHEYWFGSSLYVAPVVRRGARSREFWLPPGTWFDWWNFGTVRGGARITRDTPLSYIPLYQKEGTIVPMLAPDVQTLASSSDPNVIDMDDRANTLDARVTLTRAAPFARAVLVDGTILEASLASGEIALPWNINLEAWDTDPTSCERCGKIEWVRFGTQHVRINTVGDVNARALTLRVVSAKPSLRVRWDVAVLP